MLGTPPEKRIRGTPSAISFPNCLSLANRNDTLRTDLTRSQPGAEPETEEGRDRNLAVKQSLLRSSLLLHVPSLDGSFRSIPLHHGMAIEPKIFDPAVRGGIFYNKINELIKIMESS